MASAIAVISALIIGGLLVIIKRRNLLKYTNCWRVPRLSIYLGILFAAMRWLDTYLGGLVSACVLLLLFLDLMLGYYARGRDGIREYMTLGQEARSAAVCIWQTLKFGVLHIASLLAPRGWKIELNPNSKSVRVVKRIVDWSRNSTVALFVLIYGGVFVLAILMLSLFGVLGLTWVAANGSEEAAALRQMGSILLMLYGPFIATSWLVSCVIVGVFGTLVGNRENAVRLPSLFAYFAGATGFGAAMGLLAGVLSPAAWNLVKYWQIFDSLISGSPPISGDLALACSSLGIVIGALAGMYLSLRRSAWNISNLIYRELAVFGPVVMGALIARWLKPVSPDEMLRLILRESVGVSAKDCAAGEKFEALKAPDVAFCLDSANTSFFVGGAEMMWAIFWVALLLGVVSLGTVFVGRLLVKSDTSPGGDATGFGVANGAPKAFDGAAVERARFDH